MAKQGDVSRRRRTTTPPRILWYANWRALRFARRFGGVAVVPSESPAQTLINAWERQMSRVGYSIPA